MGGTLEDFDGLKQHYEAIQKIKQQQQYQNQQLPQQQIRFPQQQLGGLLGATYKRPALSDSDIELMAICIANKHPQMEGSNGCFCAMKRLEKGISKD